MKSHSARRLAACAGLPILAILVSPIISCRDSVKPMEGRVRSNGATRTSAARAQVHARNAHEWVGVAHNRALDDYRRELRKPGTLTSDACAYIAEFMGKAERIPTERRTRAPSNEAVDHVLRSAGCGKKPGVRRTANVLPASSLSVEASQFLQDVETAIAGASNSSDLATRLLPILDASQSLDGSEREVVQATISVAQNSGEYWENNLTAVMQEMLSEYGNCFASNPGVSEEALHSLCVAGGTGSDARLRSRGERARIRLAWTPEPDCDLSHAGQERRWNNFVGADARGAFHGGFVGAFGGALIQGALLGGAAGSIWAAGSNVVNAYRCLYAE